MSVYSYNFKNMERFGNESVILYTTTYLLNANDIEIKKPKEQN